MGNVCKTRARVPAANHSAKDKIIYERYEKKLPAVRHARPAPKDSWARLREADASLNPDAAPFNPGKGKHPVAAVQQHSPAVVQTTTPAAGPAKPADVDDVDYVQYLPGGLVTTRHPPVLLEPTRLARKARHAPAVPQEGNGAAGKGFVFKTDEYMRLLKDGCDNAKSTQGGQRPRHTEIVQGSGGTRQTGFYDKTDKLAAVPAALRAHASKKGNETAVELSYVGLGKLWSDAFAPTVIPILDRETKANKYPFIDDTFVERMTKDRDTSEEAYWSDGGDGTYGTYAASAHKLRRPKPSVVRSYVMQDLNEELDEVTALMLGRVQRFNDQLKEFGPELANHRRFIIGLKEVFRRLKQGQVKVLIVAPDIEGAAERGGHDDRMREVLAYAYTHEVPVIFALSRKRIGRAVCKPLNISILGIVDTKGAQDLCGKAMDLVRTHRGNWLARNT